jgi:membrane protease YdiL (CAAX protease family)
VLFLVAGSVLAPVLAHGAYNLVYLLVVRSRTGEWWVRVRERDEASS